MLSRLRMLQDQGKLETAEASFRRILATAPDHLHAQLGLACCRWLQGDRAGARTRFATVLAAPPAEPDLLLDSAETLLATDHRAEARALLLPRHAAQPRLAEKLGQIEEQDGHLAAAARCYRQALETGGFSGRALRGLALALLRAGDRTGAFAAVSRWTADDPALAGTAARLRGEVHRALGETAAAIAAFRESLALQPEGRQRHLDLAAELRRVQRFGEALAVLDALEPAADSLLARAEIALAQQDHDAALRHVDAALEGAPDTLHPLQLRFRIALDRRDAEGALAAADRIEALGSAHHAAAHRCRLEAYRSLGREAEALALVERMQAAQPDDPGTALECARQHRRMGDRRAAEAQLQAALALHPDHVGLLTEAHDFALALDDAETALAFARSLAERQPELSSHQLRLLHLLQRLGHEAAADASWATIETRFSGDIAVKMEGVRRLQRIGAVDEARARATALCADHPASMAAWSLLYELTVTRGSVEEAAALLPQAPAQTRGDQVTVLYSRARLARRRHQDAVARNHLLAALDLSPRNQMLLHSLFSLALRRFSVAEAQDYVRQLTVLQEAGRRFSQKAIGLYQTFEGQMLNDILLDGAARAQLEALHPLPPEDRLAQLLPAMRARPDHLPTASMITVTLRDAGAFAQAEDPAAPAAIPPLIGQYWHDDALPRDVAEVSASWQRLNPGWTYRRFNHESALAYLKAGFPPAVALAYQRAPDATTRADLLRLAVLFRDGGLWADMDDRCLQPVARFLRPGAEALFWQESTGNLGNNVIAARPNHPIMGRALALAVGAIHRGDRDNVWMLTGPGLLTRAFAISLAETSVPWRDWLGRIQIIDDFELWQLVAYHCQLSYKQAGRHWSKRLFNQTQSPLRLNLDQASRPATPVAGVPSLLDA